MNIKFVVSHLDQQSGPFTEAEIKAKWQSGDFLPIDYVYDEVKQDWILLADRFEWAANKPTPVAEEVAPPPITEKQVPRRRPTEIPAAIEIKGASVMKEWNKPPNQGGQGAKVKLVDGIGEIDLSPLQPGKVELVLQDSSATLLKLQDPLKINVKAAEPVEIVWAFPTSQTCGQEVELMIKALDDHGHICDHYNDQFVIQVRGGTAQDVVAKLENGQAALKFQNTKAEAWTLSVQYVGTRRLKMPEARSMEWQPGPATKLVLDGPQEYLAGLPLKVQVKAVDSFGNLAKTFQGTVILEVKAS